MKGSRSEHLKQKRSTSGSSRGSQASLWVDARDGNKRDGAAAPGGDSLGVGRSEFIRKQGLHSIRVRKQFEHNDVCGRIKRLDTCKSLKNKEMKYALN